MTADGAVQRAAGSHRRPTGGIMAEQALHGFEAVAAGIYLEGLAVDPARDLIWYSDVIAGGIHGVAPDGSAVHAFNEGRMWTGGVLVNGDGAILSSGEGGIMWNHPESGRSGWLITELDGVPVNGINEMAPDGAGGIVFGTNDIANVITGTPTRPTALYRLSADRRLTLLAEDIGFSNGLAFDAARRLFYCNDTFDGTWAFDVTDDLALANRRRLLQKDDADGMALDADGVVWITGFRSDFFTRVAPDGTRLPDVATPAGSITQLRFGGADLRDCYFNSVPSDGGDTLKEGGALTQRKSVLYRARAAIAGLPPVPTRFDL